MTSTEGSLFPKRQEDTLHLIESFFVCHERRAQPITGHAPLGDDGKLCRRARRIKMRKGLVQPTARQVFSVIGLHSFAEQAEAKTQGRPDDNDQLNPGEQHKECGGIYLRPVEQLVATMEPLPIAKDILDVAKAGARNLFG